MKRLILMALFALAACDAGPSAVMHDGAGTSPTGQAAPQPVAQADAGDDEASMAVPATATPQPATPPVTEAATAATLSATRYGDWPLWSSNSKYSADDNARYQFGKHGGEVGARTYPDYIAMVHGFIHHPPKGTQTARRGNGDTLFYDPRQNLFAVMTRDGAPRTFFKPDDGAAYWQQQKADAAGKGNGDTN